MTIRRAQGATLGLIALFFDRRLADRGYAYVGVSRARHRRDIYHMGAVRRTDWRPVGGNPEEEQGEPSIMSESDSEDDCDIDSEDEGRWAKLLMQGGAIP